jgi:tRNA pseudouridine55 synthase
MEGSDRSGIIVIDKPAGLTSAKVVAVVKKLLGVRKAGHTGTLDPFATGVMICCTNRATKLARFFLEGWKTYSAVLHLGVETDTQDSTGEVTASNGSIDFSENAIKSTIQRFEGKHRQVPPAYSALKHRGVPLYKLARRGMPVVKPSREVQISDIRVIEIDLPLIRFEATCSSGTYIRTLCSDIGKALGCGGHLKALRRTACSGFTIDKAVTLPQLEALSATGKADTTMISMAKALSGMPTHAADSGLINKLSRGIKITKEDVSPDQTEHADGFVKIVDETRNLIAILAHGKGDSGYRYVVNFNG